MALAAELASPPRARPAGAAPASAPTTDTLMAENTAAAAASAVGNLVRALAAERPAAPALRPNGPPVDQILRDLLRPIVKEWLDRELPNMTERLVRAEVRRIVGRGT